MPSSSSRATMRAPSSARADTRCGGERAGEPVEATHELERQVAGAAQKGADVGVGDAEPGVDLVQNGFVAGDREWHRDAMQRHPVDLAFPARPVPVGGRVAERAEVEVVGGPCSCDPAGRRRRRQAFEPQRKLGVPAHTPPARFAQIGVKPHRRGERVGRPDLVARRLRGTRTRELHRLERCEDDRSAAVLPSTRSARARTTSVIP